MCIWYEFIIHDFQSSISEKGFLQKYFFYLLDNNVKYVEMVTASNLRLSQLSLRAALNFVTKQVPRSCF